MFADAEIKALLVSFKDKKNTSAGREYIALAINRLSQTDAGRALFTDDNQIKQFLVSFKDKENTPMCMTYIAGAIGYLFKTDAGRVMFTDAETKALLMSFKDKENTSVFFKRIIAKSIAILFPTEDGRS